MKLIAAILLVASPTCFSADIASCSAPEGKSYYPEIGITAKENTGWKDDKITQGITKLVKLSKDTYDIVYVDFRQEIISATQEGATVFRLSSGPDVVSVLVVYPAGSAEIYTFAKTRSGKLEYIHTTNKSGDGVLISRSSVMVGKCSYINLANL